MQKSCTNDFVIVEKYKRYCPFAAAKHYAAVIARLVKSVYKYGCPLPHISAHVDYDRWCYSAGGL